MSFSQNSHYQRSSSLTSSCDLPFSRYYTQRRLRNRKLSETIRINIDYHLKPNRILNCKKVTQTELLSQKKTKLSDHDRQWEEKFKINLHDNLMVRKAQVSSGQHHSSPLSIRTCKSLSMSISDKLKTDFSQTQSLNQPIDKRRIQKSKSSNLPTEKSQFMEQEELIRKRTDPVNLGMGQKKIKNNLCKQIFSLSIINEKLEKQGLVQQKIYNQQTHREMAVQTEGFLPSVSQKEQISPELNEMSYQQLSEEISTRLSKIMISLNNSSIIVKSPEIKQKQTEEIFTFAKQQLVQSLLTNQNYTSKSSLSPIIQQFAIDQRLNIHEEKEETPEKYFQSNFKLTSKQDDKVENLPTKAFCKKKLFKNTLDNTQTSDLENQQYISNIQPQNISNAKTHLALFMTKEI